MQHVGGCAGGTYRVDLRPSNRLGDRQVSGHCWGLAASQRFRCGMDRSPGDGRVPDRSRAHRPESGVCGPLRGSPASRVNGTKSALLLSAEKHIDKRWHNEPWTYHNGGIWPYIGGFHVVALAESDMEQQAEELLQALARANSVGRNDERWQFHEWLHGESGEPAGAARQAWNAGTFVMAWHALQDTARVRSLFVRI